MAATMVPPSGMLPDVLPTERLSATGMPVPAVRAELRRIRDLANIATVAVVWVQAAVTIGIVVWLGHPLAYAMGVVMMGPVFARFAIIGHEAAHRLLFTNKRVNDTVGRLLIASPALIPLEVYRRGHFAHHRDEFGPDEPDLNLYRGYPISRASLRRKLVRDAVGISGWKNLAPLLRALRGGSTQRIAIRIVSVQLVIAAVTTIAINPFVYPVLWLLPWMTTWRVLNRLRAIAEHGGMERSTDRRRTTHHVRQSALARFWLVPLNTGWHLAHHVDMGVPWRNLPALHGELVRAGWVSEGLEYPSYRALWAALSSGDASPGDMSSDDMSSGGTPASR